MLRCFARLLGSRQLGVVLIILLGMVTGAVAQASQIVQPVAGRIAFVSSRDGSDQIYVMDANGSNVARLTNIPGVNWFPTFSPDGRKIAFSSVDGEDLQIYTMNADGSKVMRLTNPPGGNWFPRFSPDGRKIAFTSKRDGAAQIYVMDTDGSNVTRLTSPPGTGVSAKFSPDGSRIVFMSKRGADFQIYVMNADGSNAIPLTSPPGESVDPVFSPDGRKIAFRSDRNGNHQIYIMDADGSHVSRLTSPPGESEFPTFSSDGTKIAFVSNREGSRQIYVMIVDGSDVVRLTDRPGLNFDPAFGPPGPPLPPSASLLRADAFCTVDPTITPGVGISRLKLGMALTEVREFLAAPPNPVLRGTSGISTWEEFTYHPAGHSGGGLAFVAQDDHLVYITLGFTEEVTRCVTRDGIRVGGSTAGIKAAYGNPEGTFQLNNTNFAWWVYNSRGLELGVNDQGQVLFVGVFTPGAYCKLHEPISRFESGTVPPPACTDFKPPLTSS